MKVILHIKIKIFRSKAQKSKATLKILCKLAMFKIMQNKKIKLKKIYQNFNFFIILQNQTRNLYLQIKINKMIIKNNWNLQYSVYHSLWIKIIRFNGLMKIVQL